MNMLEAALLGLVQGLAEFLPISSSGHLALLEHFFGIEGESALTFAVMLHIGTLIAVIAAYWRDLTALIFELCMVFRDIFTRKGLNASESGTRKLGFLIIVATIPTGVMGVLLNDVFSAMYLSLKAVGAGFLITGTVLFIAERAGSDDKGFLEMKYRSSLLVGICQGVAIWPGISRSGATIFGSLLGGLRRVDAVRFAFLISLPVILGSAVMEAPKAFREGADAAMAAPIALGMAVAAASGFFAIKTMVRVISGKRLLGFSLYTWALGACVLIYAIFVQ